MNEAQIKDIGSKFDLYPSPPEEARYSFTAQDLINVEGIRAFVDCYGPLMKALDDKAVAAYFGGWFSSLALAVQYSVSLYSNVPVINLSNLRIHLIPASGYCRVAFSLNSWVMEPAPADEQGRVTWRNKVFTEFYRNTASPLLRTMSAASGLRLGEIWGQLPSKFNYYIEMLAAGDSNKEFLIHVQDDYSYLRKGLAAEVFQLPRNPFDVEVRKIESLADPEQRVHMRNRCCLYYRTEGGSVCYTCPRLKEEERATRRAEYRIQAASSQV
ncbi:hypothetical protein H70357_19580 [Paenibacillus sp. FSL H7-0357]|uniref:(2Fe-2S)-binding protein n=1 Tax=Paenibacillus sp. FSL H7-0357 TaxID=1536774 RepID=UPI0004F7166C|nr:(2Fe-2S)-binding protein [Paenibacillus sp. FSL H7-0357]AIQ18654.1 hypothetical protein H70357_19580 [Paenibacillus sp. FSL H7-0357]